MVSRPQRILNKWREEKVRKAHELQRRLNAIRSKWKQQAKQELQAVKTTEVDEEVMFTAAQEQTQYDEDEHTSGEYVSSDVNDSMNITTPENDERPEKQAPSEKAKLQSESITASDTQKLSDGDYDTTPDLQDNGAVTKPDSDVDITKLYFDTQEASDHNKGKSTTTSKTLDNDIDITKLYFEKDNATNAKANNRRRKHQKLKRKRKAETAYAKSHETAPTRIKTKAGIRKRTKATGSSDGEEEN